MLLIRKPYETSTTTTITNDLDYEKIFSGNISLNDVLVDSTGFVVGKRLDLLHLQFLHEKKKKKTVRDCSDSVNTT